MLKFWLEELSYHSTYNTFIARWVSLFYECTFSSVPRSPRFDQGNVSSDTESIHVISSFNIIQSIQHHFELFYPWDTGKMIKI